MLLAFYINPPAHSLVLSVDEKNQIIQTLGRHQRVLALL